MRAQCSAFLQPTCPAVAHAAILLHAHQHRLLQAAEAAALQARPQLVQVPGMCLGVGGSASVLCSLFTWTGMIVITMLHAVRCPLT